MVYFVPILSSFYQNRKGLEGTKGPAWDSTHAPLVQELFVLNLENLRFGDSAELMR